MLLLLLQSETSSLAISTQTYTIFRITFSNRPSFKSFFLGFIRMPVQKEEKKECYIVGNDRLFDENINGRFRFALP